MGHQNGLSCMNNSLGSSKKDRSSITSSNSDWLWLSKFTLNRHINIQWSSKQNKNSPSPFQSSQSSSTRTWNPYWCTRTRLPVLEKTFVRDVSELKAILGSSSGILCSHQQYFKVKFWTWKHRVSYLILPSLLSILFIP